MITKEKIQKYLKNDYLVTIENTKECGKVLVLRKNKHYAAVTLSSNEFEMKFKTFISNILLPMKTTLDKAI